MFRYSLKININNSKASAWATTSEKVHLTRLSTQTTYVLELNARSEPEHILHDEQRTHINITPERATPTALRAYRL